MVLALPAATARQQVQQALAWTGSLLSLGQVDLDQLALRGAAKLFWGLLLL
jgi:hypothetical protein